MKLNASDPDALLWPDAQTQGCRKGAGVLHIFIIWSAGVELSLRNYQDTPRLLWNLNVICGNHDIQPKTFPQALGSSSDLTSSFLKMASNFTVPYKPMPHIFSDYNFIPYIHISHLSRKNCMQAHVFLYNFIILIVYSVEHRMKSCPLCSFPQDSLIFVFLVPNTVRKFYYSITMGGGIGNDAMTSF
jgi:hypothetical protein